MKIKQLNITKIFLAVVAIVAFTACENDDFLPEFTLQEASEQVAFTNSVSDEYLLSAETENNIAERFVWNTPNFDVQTAISYSVEGSIAEDFSTLEYESGVITETNHAITVKTLLDIAQNTLGLDTDPNTEDPGNTGKVYFRVRAFVGSGSGSDAIQSTSENIIVNVNLIEEAITGSGIELSPWGIVGSGYNNWGAYADSPFYTTSEANVFVAYATLLDGEIKIRKDNAWDENFGDSGADGTLDAGGDNIVVTAGTYKIVLNLNDNTYTIEEFSWGIVGSGYNDWGATPDAKFYYDYTTDTFKVGVRLLDGEIKIRKNNAWDQDFGDSGADGTLDAGGDNIAVTAGHYAITIDFNTNTYTIETANLYGVVGSGYNDWGATPDFTFTEVNPGIWIAEIVPLIDGEIKFRINNAWDQDFGDSGADGTLDAGGDNIAVTAGNYRIFLDTNNGTYSINQ